jgi:glycosyltransferase involved in cell wall biosynthesis
MKILHVITALNDGGAEAILFRVCKAKKTHYEHIIVSMMDLGKYGRLLEEEGFKVYSLNMLRGCISLKGLTLLWKIIKVNKPDIVQTWLYHADFIGGIISYILGVKNIVWGIHNYDFYSKNVKFRNKIIVFACAILSYVIPNSIISCSKRAADVHKNIGYVSKKFNIIHNGIDLDVFFKNNKSRINIRNQFSVPLKALLLGMVARWDIQKDHKNLFSALSGLKKKRKDFKCLLVGAGLEQTNNDLIKLIEQYNLQNNIILGGSCEYIQDIMNALDLHILSSRAEAFANVVAEAMACEVPCLSTDVGAIKLIQGNTGWIVPPSDSKALQTSLEEALDEINKNTYDIRKKNCRERILKRYNVNKMINQYYEIWST